MSASTSPARKADSRLILLVEDNPDHAELVRRALGVEQPPIDIHHVTDGAAALAFLADVMSPDATRGSKPRPRLILLDLRLPKVDGIDVLRQVKSAPTMQHIPVVMLTTSTSEADVVRAHRHHVNSYLKKPLDFTEFMRMMKDVVCYWLTWNHAPV